MRVSQRQMFTQYIGHMNNSLSGLMESNNQSSTQKRINRPSDDPAGMARVMMYRESLNGIERNKANISEATGWLNLVDHSLMGVSDIITKIKTLNLQSATGTQNSDNREQNATQLRAYLGELLNWANGEYNGQHIFAGHKVDQPAYGMRLGVTCDYKDPVSGDKLIDQIDFEATGDESYSTSIQFLDDGQLGIDQPRFIYSHDGGTTWDEGFWDGDGNMVAGGTVVKIHQKDPLNPVFPAVTAVTPDSTSSNGVEYAGKESAGGTWLTVRPTAAYLGDDHDTEITQSYGPAVGASSQVKGEGSFTRDITVRIKHPAALPSTDPIEYEYSLDNGSNWIKATASAGSQQLAVPGGYLRIDPAPAAGEGFQAGQEFLIHPRRADINFEISNNQSITVNMVGKDVFGGIYQEPFTDHPTVVAGPNIFETVGKLIGYCETNNSDGIAQCLEELEDCQKYIGTRLADIGGRENRIAVAFETASIRELSETNAMSAIEDVDVITLMTKLAQQQLAYNTVLKSSSMIMQMSLMNFI